MATPDAGPPEGESGAETVASLATRGFVRRPGRTIAMATLAGLLAMQISFVVTPSPLVAVAALLAGMLLVLGTRAGDVRLRLTSEGIHRSFVPFADLGSRRERELFVPFAAMRSYRRDRDWSRYRSREVESLVIAFRGPPFRLVIHDMIDQPAFAAFAERFEALAARAAVPRRPGFYATLWAKLLLAMFAAAAGVLVVFLAAGTLSPTNSFRLLVVILPGVGYMGWRILGSHGHASDRNAQATGKGG